MIDCLEEAPEDAFDKLKNELATYSSDLGNKPFMIALNKIDSAENRDDIRSLKIGGNQPYVISAVTGEGVKELIYGIWDELKKLSD